MNKHSDVLGQLERSAEVIRVHPLVSGTSKEQNDGPQFQGNYMISPQGDGSVLFEKTDGGGGKVLWDPTLGLKTSSGAISSPAFVLMPEFIHALRFVNHFDAFAKAIIDDYEAKLRMGKTKSGFDVDRIILESFDSFEELRTIEMTNFYARHYPLEAKDRTDHRGNLVRTFGSTNTTPEPTFSPIP